jgi:hypothetical protein
MESEFLRSRIDDPPVGKEPDWLTGLVLRARWSDLEPAGPVSGGYPVLTEALEWARSAGRPFAIQIGCVGSVTHSPAEIPAWVADSVQTVQRLGRRPYLVPWDPDLRERWQGFVGRVAATVLPLMTPPLTFGTVGVAQPGQDAEMNVTSAYLQALKTTFTESYIEGAWVETWLEAEAFTRATWGTSRMLTCSPGDIAGGATEEILDALRDDGAAFALGNGNLAKYPTNTPSQWQRRYLGQFPLVGLTETPDGGEDPAAALDAERIRVYEPLGLRRVTVKPDAAGVGHDGATPEHQAVLRRIAAYLRRPGSTAG